MHLLWFVGIFSNFGEAVKWELSEMDFWRHKQNNPPESSVIIALFHYF